jgi:transposase
MDLTDEQWIVLAPLLPNPPNRADGRGRPWRDTREVLNGVLWVLRTGAPWRDLPERYPPYQTCHRRFQGWACDGTLRQVRATLAEDLKKWGGVNLSACFIDGTFVPAKKGGQSVGKTKRGKGTKLMVVADRSGLPVSVHAASASPHEVTLVKATLEASFVEDKPKRLIGDRAYDSEPLDAQLKAEGIEMISPHRKGRKSRRPRRGAS